MSIWRAGRMEFQRASAGVSGRGKYTIRVLVGRVCAEGMEGWFEVMEQVVSRVKIEVGPKCGGAVL